MAMAILKFVFVLLVIVGRPDVNAVTLEGQLGDATSYEPPYFPTRCPGYSIEQFPGDGLIAAVSLVLWEKGAARGRKYRIQCLSGLRDPCKNDTTEVEIVDLCRTDPCPAMLVLSTKAFEAISKIPKAKINIKYVRI